MLFISYVIVMLIGPTLEDSSHLVVVSGGRWSALLTT